MVLAFSVAKLFRHGWQGDSFRKVGQRINQASLLGVAVIERAAVCELASSTFHPVLAGNGLVVGVDGSESGLAKVLGQSVSGCSQFGLSVSELAVLV